MFHANFILYNHYLVRNNLTEIVIFGWSMVLSGRLPALIRVREGGQSNSVARVTVEWSSCWRMHVTMYDAE